METEGRHRSLTALERDPVIILNPSLEGSWFILPKPVAPDTVGYWPRHTKFPGSSDSTHVPYDERKLTPLKFLYHVQDDLLESFLSPARWTDRSGNLWLNSEVFASASFHVSASNVCPSVDRGLRAQLTDNLITDELIDITEKLTTIALDIPKDNPNATAQEIINYIMDMLELINTSVILSSASHLRGRHSTLTSIVKNKLTLRDEVLRVHTGGAGSAFTKEVLRGSSFFSADLFGALPDSLLTNCVHSSQYILKPFKASSSGGQTSNSRNTSSSYNSHAATSTPASAASNRGYYNNHINYQYYNNNKPQHQQQSSNNKQNNYNQNKTTNPRGFYYRRAQRSKDRPAAPTSAPYQAKKDGR